MTKFFGYLIIVILSMLLTVPLSSSIYAQDYDIPNMENFEVPSQEEIKAMMETKRVSGKYTNFMHQVEVTFPVGWSGMESNHKDSGTQTLTTSVAVMHGGIQANMNSMQERKFNIIVLSIMDKIEGEPAPPDFEPPTEAQEYESGCAIVETEKIKVNNMHSYKSTIKCEGDGIPIKAKTHHFNTEDKWIILAYAASPSSEFDKDASKYDSTVSTIKIANSIDIDYDFKLPGEGYAESPTTKTPMDKTSAVPEWIKNNASWWASEQIDDNAFVQGIQYLVKNHIIQV